MAFSDVLYDNVSYSNLFVLFCPFFYQFIIVHGSVHVFKIMEDRITSLCHETSL